MSYQAIIGLEIHLQLISESKLFSSAPASFNKTPNSHVMPLDMAYPGAMPVLNKRCVISAIKMCHALNMNIERLLRFDRKNYFYSDLAKGYQITQFFHPIGTNGYLEIGDNKVIHINHLHIEEDSAKQIHVDNRTLLDFNRSGVGLIEIVTDPDIRNGKEARLFLERIRDLAVSLGISNGRLQEGSMRVDTNVSLRNTDTNQEGTIIELKNLNGFKHIENAIDYEIKRQTEILNSGKTIKAETRRYDENKKATVFMRKKNTRIDYRYFTDADIAPVRLSEEFIDYAINYVSEKHKKINLDILNKKQLDEINSDLYYVKLFNSLINKGLASLRVCNFILTRIKGEHKRHGEEKLISVEPDVLRLLELYEKEQLTYKQASIIFNELVNGDDSLDSLLNKHSFSSNYDYKGLSSIIDDILVKYKNAVNDYHSGKSKALNYLLGQIYKKTNSNVDSIRVKEMLLEKLEEK